MTITVEYLVGDPERFDETIRRLVANNWDASKTKDQTPEVFISPHGEGKNAADTTKAKSARDWQAFVNKNLIRFKQLDTIRQDLGTVGNKTVRLLTTIVVDIFAVTPHLAFLFGEEVNRTIFENLPNQTTRIKKSNGTEDSAIATFDRQQIEFIEIPEEFGDIEITYQLSGELGLMWQKRKS